MNNKVYLVYAINKDGQRVLYVTTNKENADTQLAEFRQKIDRDNYYFFYIDEMEFDKHVEI